mgnify:FL=1
MPKNINYDIIIESKFNYLLNLSKDFKKENMSNTAIETQKNEATIKKNKNTIEITDKIEKLLMTGDLKDLQPSERVYYYNNLCTSLGLNPMTRPFEYVAFQGKTVLYARKDCAEQLRKIHGITIIESIQEEKFGCLITITKVKDRSGREDIGRGAVPIEGAKPV